MSQWVDKFNSHQVHRTLEQLEVLLNDFDDDVLTKEPAAVDLVERIKQVTNFTKSRLNNADPNLVPHNNLNNLNASFSSVSAEVSAFKSNRNIGHLSNAISHIDNVLVYLSNIPVPLGSGDMEGLRDAVTSYRRSAGQYIRNIDDEYKSLNKKFQEITANLTQLTSEISSQKQRIDNVISNFQDQFSNAEERRRAEFQAAEKERKEKADSLYTDIENKLDELIEGKDTSYSAKIEEIKAAFDKLSVDVKSNSDALFEDIKSTSASSLDEFNGNITAALKNFNSTSTKAVNTFTSEANSAMADILENKERAEKLVGIITDTGMVGGYQRVANSEGKAAILWRVIATLCFAGLIVFAIYAYTSAFNHEVKWGEFAARIFVATSFGILAAYAALQADKHEKAERKNRKIELELASISPYLHSLPVEQQHKIKAELASRLFGNNESIEEKVDKKTTGSIIDVLKLALESIQNLSKK